MNSLPPAALFFIIPPPPPTTRISKVGVGSAHVWVVIQQIWTKKNSFWSRQQPFGDRRGADIINSLQAKTQAQVTI